MSRDRQSLRERLADRVEVLNGAVPGYTTHQERLWLETEFASLEPNLVLLQYCLNDNFEFLHRFEPGSSILVTEEARGGRLAAQLQRAGRPTERRGLN